MTRRAPTDQPRRPLIPSRWRIPLLLATAAVLVTVGVLVARGVGRPVVVMRGGVVEIQFTTDDQTAQQTLARRCGLADPTQMTPVHVRYSFPASQKDDVLACVEGSSLVRAVGLPG